MTFATVLTPKGQSWYHVCTDNLDVGSPYLYRALHLGSGGKRDMYLEYKVMMLQLLSLLPRAFMILGCHLQVDNPPWFDFVDSLCTQDT